MGTPSYCSESISKPREVIKPPVPGLLAKVMPGALANSVGKSVMFWSSMRLRVITDTLCGMSLSLCSLLPMVTPPVVYELLPSVVTPNVLPVMLVAPSSSAEDAARSRRTRVRVSPSRL